MSLSKHLDIHPTDRIFDVPNSVFNGGTDSLGGILREIFQRCYTNLLHSKLLDIRKYQVQPKVPYTPHCSLNYAKYGSTQYTFYITVIKHRKMS